MSQVVVDNARKSHVEQQYVSLCYCGEERQRDVCYSVRPVGNMSTGGQIESRRVSDGRVGSSSSTTSSLSSIQIQLTDSYLFIGPSSSFSSALRAGLRYRNESCSWGERISRCNNEDRDSIHRMRGCCFGGERDEFRRVAMAMMKLGNSIDLQSPLVY